MASLMFAIVQTGGKQYRVKAGDELDIERLEFPKSKSIKLDRVLLISKEANAQVGKPFVNGAWCEAELVREIKAPKVISFKYIRREKAATKIGHRQQVVRVKIKSIHQGQ